MIQPGGFVLQGFASDTRAQGNTLGVDRIDFFLDSRDQGGMNLGTVVPGMLPGPFGPTSFQTTVSIPNVVGGHDLFAYAHSSASGVEDVIAVPVAVGEDPSKAGDLGTTSSEMCSSGSTGAMAAPATPVSTPPVTTAPTTPAPAPATTTTTTTPVESTSSTITLEVSNPSPGDTVHAGGLAIDGTASDMSAQAGGGVDRIDIFLDSRDAGGMILTEAMPGANGMWHAVVPLPANQTGLHSLFFYAHSSSGGHEAVVSIPVTIAP